MRVLTGLEWSSDADSAPLVLADENCSAELFGPFAEKAMDAFRVIGIPLSSHWDPITTSWWAGEPVVLVAQGNAGKLACEAAIAAPGAIRALILADYAPEDGSTSHKGVVLPTLVFHGRQSDAKTHAQAVKLHEEIQGSHLIEPENCGAAPTKSCAEPLSAAVKWFVSELSNPHMEFQTGTEPVDPRA